MKSTLLLLLLLFIHSGNAWSQVNTDLKVENLKGKVKYISSDIYDVTDRTGKEEKIWVFSGNEMFNRSGNFVYDAYRNAKTYFDDSTSYTYDSLQNLLIEEVYEEHGLLEKRTVSTYNVKGQTLTETVLEYDIDDDSGEITDTFIHTDRYSYNDCDLVDEMWRSSLQAEGNMSPYRLYIKNIYEDSGRIRYQYEYRSSEQPAVADTYFTRKSLQGKIIESRNSQTHYLTTYDSDGHQIKMTNLALDGSKTISTVLYTYDKWGNCTSTTTYDADGKIAGDTITSEYLKVDRKGNWREVKSYRNGKYCYYCKRKIKYF